MEKRDLHIKEELWKMIYESFLRSYETMTTCLNDHQGMKGTKNENLLINFLKPFVPANFQIEQDKKILNYEGNSSKQQDIIIWDSFNSPRIFEDNSPFFLMETVYATIETKTTLRESDLKNALLNIQDLRKLYKIENPDLTPPLSMIFAYDTDWKKSSSIFTNIGTIIEENKIQQNEVFDYLLIMKKGIICRWNDPRKWPSTKVRTKFGVGTILHMDGSEFFPFMYDIKEHPPLKLSIMSVHSTDKGFQDILVEKQIEGMVDFLCVLTNGLRLQRKMDPNLVIKRSLGLKSMSKGGSTQAESYWK